MSPHAAMIPRLEVIIHVSSLGLMSIVLRSNPQVLGAPIKEVTWDSWLSVSLWEQGFCSSEEVGEKGKAV